jgi:hypothetical protein
MRESRTYGSVRGARGNARPYRDPSAILEASGQPTGDRNRVAEDASLFRPTYR